MCNKKTPSLNSASVKKRIYYVNITSYHNLHVKTVLTETFGGNWIMYCDAKLYKRQVLIKLSDDAKFLYHDKEFLFLLQ